MARARTLGGAGTRAEGHSRPLAPVSCVLAPSLPSRALPPHAPSLPRSLTPSHWVGLSPAVGGEVAVVDVEQRPPLQARHLRPSLFDQSIFQAVRDQYI